MKHILSHRSASLILIAIVLTIAVCIAFAPSTWPTMMLRSFLPQWALCFGALAALLLVLRRWREGVIIACSALLIAPSMGGHGSGADAAFEPMLRVAHFNVLQSNEAYTDVIERMRASDADVIGVQEVDPGWEQALRDGLSDQYPFSLTEPRTDRYGIALFSRVPLKLARVIRLGASPAVEVTVQHGSKELRLISVHASSPGSPGHFSARNEQFDRLADHMRSSTAPTMIVGDLNAAPWDKDLLRFLARTGLRTHATVTDPTFPSVAHLALIPIDHVLCDDRVRVSQRSVHLPGSDHRGVIADVAW